jgi:hypothetical protein
LSDIKSLGRSCASAFWHYMTSVARNATPRQLEGFSIDPLQKILCASRNRPVTKSKNKSQPCLISNLQAVRACP